MNITDKVLQIQQLAMAISDANIAIVTTDYFGSTKSLMVKAYPIGTFNVQGRDIVTILNEDIDLQPTRWITEEHINQQLDHTLLQLHLIKSPASSQGQAA
ncbi:hypothetical protein [uncultured Amphritea sp.]|uniref:hypothetical protein n=1 Tax=uncultured Amphritea sp. TaxID=981605 RepID=UPI00263A2BC1|nr:hypothetical protein [uncultured Amphritea sp.]